MLRSGHSGAGVVEPETPHGAAEPPSREVIVFDDSFSDPAFYPVERRGSDGLVFRWMGRQDEATIPTKINRASPVRIEVHLAHFIDTVALDGLRIGIDGRYAYNYSTKVFDSGNTLKTAEFDFYDDDPDDLIVVNLKVLTKTDLSDRGDNRTLAVAVHKLVVQKI
ncbi:hypothetical protein [Acuticoccus mangrovi]|uniref:Uncharacterized protein n=1 Tax=Acuticoccus mangrovi TaxID=2796142 RepID=A0A934IFT3_9HYPH|nr:hypothetical protein [Acuticoccus mangrovi]MBJ3775698.1 hypothetical protein [Acuticoccus mangrovi]